MKSKSEIKNRVTKLIKKSFPILKGKKIFVYYFSNGPFSGGAFWILPFWRALFINKKRRFNKEKLTGLIVHELCHFGVYQKMGWLKTNFFGLLYLISSQFRRKEERRIDEMVIRKGYARQIYEQRLSRWNSTPKNYKLKKMYMSPEKIKTYAKRIGKW